MYICLTYSNMVSVKSIHISLQKTKKVCIYVYFLYLSNGLGWLVA